MDKTKIEWADATWNPLRGCSKVSPGCANCYAERMAMRFCGDGEPYFGVADRAGWTRSVRMAPDRVMEQPLRWKRPRRIFVNSMSDTFHENVSFVDIASIFHIMCGEAPAEATPNHKYIILTKRADRMCHFFQWLAGYKGPYTCVEALGAALRFRGHFPNVWLGVSAENQETFDERTEWLFKTPAEIHWVSLEPLLEHVDITRAVAWPRRMNCLEWVVVGGESGPGARRCEPTWARSIAETCADYDVPVFVKQLGSWNVTRGGLCHKYYGAKGQLNVEELIQMQGVKQWPQN